MSTDIKTIFSRFSQSTLDSNESKKISYWLRKLFYQKEAQVEKTEKERLSKKQTEIDSAPNTPINQPTIHTLKLEQIAEEKGLDEAIKNHARKAETDRHKLEDMVVSSNRVLTSIKSVFPLDIFPTTIDVEATRLTVCHRQLFSSQVYAPEIKDIANVLIDENFFFATLTIISRTFIDNEIKINNLWKKEAVFLRRMIEGLRMFEKEGIDTTNFSIEELISKLKELSTTELYNKHNFPQSKIPENDNL